MFGWFKRNRIDKPKFNIKLLKMKPVDKQKHIYSTGKLFPKSEDSGFETFSQQELDDFDELLKPYFSNNLDTDTDTDTENTVTDKLEKTTVDDCIYTLCSLREKELKEVLSYFK
jgi:hypothetical protein